MKVTAINIGQKTDSAFFSTHCHCCRAWQEVQQKQQQYERERMEKEREESATPAAEPLPVR